METLNDNIKLTETEFAALKMRDELISIKDIELRLLKNERDSFLDSVFKKYNLDSKKSYNIHKDGTISEKKGE